MLYFHRRGNHSLCVAFRLAYLAMLTVLTLMQMSREYELKLKSSLNLWIYNERFSEMRMRLTCIINVKKESSLHAHTRAEREVGLNGFKGFSEWIQN